jgi:glycosyltransferase involved in cell wall biosynthesis
MGTLSVGVIRIMKVMLVSGSLAPMRCGVGDYTGELASALTRKGCTVGVLTSVDAEASIRGVSVLPYMSTWTMCEAALAVRQIKTWQPDLIHIQYPSRGYYSYVLPSFIPLLAVGMGVPLVRTWHEIPDVKRPVPFLIQCLPPGPYIYVRPEFQQKLAPMFKRALRQSTGHFLAGSSSIARVVLTEAERRAVRDRYLEGRDRLIVFFGFLYPSKGVEQIFDIANLATDRIIIAGEPGEDLAYVKNLEQLARTSRMIDSVRITGFLNAGESGRLLAAADAVVLPFRHGGGVWNSSIHAAVVQGTPVITTSLEATGLDARKMIHYARPNDIDGMRRGLERMAGLRRPPDPELDGNEWNHIASRHIEIYQKSIGKRRRHAAVSSFLCREKKKGRPCSQRMKTGV